MGELMKLFFGTKLVAAKPMTLGAYNKYRGWTIPENEDPTRAGFLVEYIGGGDKNHPDHDNYISWSPAETFEKANICVGGHSVLSNPPHVQRLMAEHVETLDRLTKLQAFQGTELFAGLAQEEKDDLILQDSIMSKLVDVLERRVRRASFTEEQAEG